MMPLKYDQLTNFHRIKDLTYKLIYPAFFGNMVYDFISLIIGFSDNFSWQYSLSVASVLVTLVFFVFDYVHLNIDLELKIGDERKDWVYMGSDICISFIFFLIVVFIKNEKYDIAFCLLSLVPMLFSIYHIRLGLDLKFYKSYGVVAVIVFFISLIVIFSISRDYIHRNDVIILCLFIAVLLYTIAYFWYTCKNYWLKKSNEKS